MSTRSDALAAQLAVLRSKAERREAVARFESGQMTTEDARAAQAFRSWLRTPGYGRAFEARAMGEGTGSTGGFSVPKRWNADLIRATREYSGLLNGFELWNSGHGEAYERPVAIPQTAGVVQTENTTFTEGPDMVFSHQPWPQCPLYAASTRISNQVIADAYNGATTPSNGVGGYTALPANPSHQPVSPGPYSIPAPSVDGNDSPTLDALVVSMLGESLGRVVAPVAATSLYAAINTVGASSAQNGGYITLGAATPVSYITGSASTELIQNTINIDTAALMVGALDVSYHDGASFYFSSTQWQNLVRQVDAQKHLQIDPGLGLSLFGFPVALTSQCSTAVLSTTSGPLFGNLRAAMTLRIGEGGTVLLRSTEKYAELMQTYFRAVIRADVAPRDARAVVGVKYAAT